VTTDPNTVFDHFLLNRDHYVYIISDLRMPSLWNGIELIEDKKTESLYKNILVTAFEITDVYSRI